MKYTKEKVKRPALDGATVVEWVYRLENDRVIAVSSKAGVEFPRAMILTTEEDLNGFARMLGDAWTEHMDFLSSAMKAIEVVGRLPQ